MTERGLLRSFDAGSMRVEVYLDHEAVSCRAVHVVFECLRKKPDAVICAATGATFERVYELLAHDGVTQPRVFAAVRVVKLDEWLGIPMTHPSTCETYLRKELLEPLGVTDDRYLSFNSEANDPFEECQRVARRLSRWGGIDLALLGLGLNGHVGLNEPAERLEPHAHVAELADETTRHAMLRSHGAVVRRGLTLGMDDLLNARRGLLVVTGAHKHSILDATLTRPPSPWLPASLLRQRKAYTCVCDAEAAGGLDD